MLLRIVLNANFIFIQGVNMKRNVDYSKSISDDWSTPLLLYEWFMNHGFLDPCPLNHTINGLNIDYYGQKLFINPPFSKLSIWCDYAIKQYKNGCDVILLMPARTDTLYFHKLLQYCPNIHFFKGRLKFGGCSSPAPFPTILVTLSKYSMDNYTHSDLYEYVCG